MLPSILIQGLTLAKSLICTLPFAPALLLDSALLVTLPFSLYNQFVTCRGW